MENTARLFHCARCRCQVTICSRCDRGQFYCGPSCREAARRASLRAAGRRYQDTHRGRMHHAQRQRNYRDRNKEVTHQGSTPPPANALLDGASQATAGGEPGPRDALRCRFCGCRCGPFLRLDYLHRSPVGRVNDFNFIAPPRHRRQPP